MSARVYVCKHAHSCSQLDFFWSCLSHVKRSEVYRLPQIKTFRPSLVGSSNFVAAQAALFFANCGWGQVQSVSRPPSGIAYS